MNGGRDISSYNPTVKEASTETTLVKNDSSTETPEFTTETNNPIKTTELTPETNYPIKTPKLTWEEVKQYANEIIQNKR